MVAKIISRAALGLMIVTIASQLGISIYAMILIWICESVYIIAGAQADIREFNHEL